VFILQGKDVSKPAGNNKWYNKLPVLNFKVCQEFVSFNEPEFALF